ncbi:MAG: hypothetical protein BGO01_16380 [Armatimonadetes bacterium 55-13]|nr:hypothetical protein [Armatimonadota bacterium]OJU65434.1 MAG: hypothetical protein BGO01_16380 [Armatimonadetes bacterium 55-13]
MPDLLDNPLGTTLEESMLGGFGGFPDRLYLIGVGGDKYAANNASLPDGQSIDGLATFPDPDEATTYMSLLAGLSGEVVSKTFEEAREITLSKPRLSCMFLFRDARIVDIHWVR